MATSQEESRVSDEDGSDSVDKYCQRCLTKERHVKACSYCRQCKQYQCSDCSSMHSSFPTLADHAIIAVEIAEQEVGIGLTELEKCSEHDKLFEFICEEHDLLCCSSCAIAGHRSCGKITELNKKAASSPENIDEIKQKFQSAKNRAERLKEHYNVLKLDVEKQFKSNEELINETNNRVMEKLLKTRHDLEQESSNLRTETDTDVKARHTIVEELCDSVEQHLKLLEGAERNNTDIHSYVFLHQARRHKLPDISSVLDKQESEQFQIHLTLENSSELEAFLDSRVRLVKVVMNKRHTGHGHISTEQNVINLPSAGAEKSCKIKEFQIIKSVNFEKETGTFCRPWYSGIAFMNDGRIIATDHANDMWHVLNENLEKQASGKFDVKPRQVSFLSDSRIAVTTSQKKIYILTVNRDNRLTLPSTLTTSVDCYSVSKLKDDILVYSTIGDKRSIRKINFSSIESDFEGVDFPDKTFGAIDSQCAYVASTNTLVLTDKKENQVILYNLDNRESFVVTNERIKSPTGVCEGPGDSVLVCCMDTNCIAQISSMGEILGVFSIDCDQPHAIAASNDKSSVLVSNRKTSKNKCLAMFTLTTIR